MLVGEIYRLWFHSNRWAGPGKSHGTPPNFCKYFSLGWPMSLEKASPVKLPGRGVVCVSRREKVGSGRIYVAQSRG